MGADYNNTCFFTGHRMIPENSRQEIMQKTADLCKELITKNNVNVFIAGGALGFDTLAATEIIKLKKI